jgi:hypothetical protein
MDSLPGFRVDAECLRIALVAQHPTLHLIETDGRPVIRGSIRIAHDGADLDWYVVEIDLGPLQRSCLPLVKEVGGRIPRIADRHMNDDGSCCVCLPEDYFLRNPGPFDMIAFLDGPVRGYFIAQTLVERGDPWPHGEWGHGMVGYDQWFKEFLDSLTPDAFRAYLETLSREKIKGHHLCPCGSGRRLRDCHFWLVLRLQRILPSKQARALLTKSRSKTR